MVDSLKRFQDQGFAVKRKPKSSTGKERKQKPVERTVVVEKPRIIEKVIQQPVAENSGVLGEVVKTNQVMHDAIAALSETMKDLGYRPKTLKCENIKRDTRGLMQSFEIKVLE